MFRVEVESKYENPNRTIYRALKQDYSSDFVMDLETPVFESKCGEIIVKNLLKGHRGHYGCIEHVGITFACGYFPHSVIQQARTHRINVSFDVQSFRYTSKGVLDVANGIKPIDHVFYFREPGFYTDRKGKKYTYSENQIKSDKQVCLEAAQRYATAIQNGLSEEHARDLLPFNYRQHFMVSFNLRSVLHFMDLRAKKDAQLEIQILCNMMWPHIKEWVPEIAEWYEQNRLGKARLAP
jgi:thymidylate synthase (FAD)